METINVRILQGLFSDIFKGGSGKHDLAYINAKTTAGRLFTSSFLIKRYGDD